MAAIFHDLRFALRTLRKTPGLTVAAVATLALGIGANSAVFSIIHAVMLRGLPYPNPRRVVVMWGTDRRPLDSFQQPSAKLLPRNKTMIATTTYLYGITPHDGLTFVALPAVLLLVCLAASYIPARRVSRLDPMMALRHE